VAAVLVVGGDKTSALEASQDSADLPFGHVAAELDDCPHQLAEMQWAAIRGGHALGEAEQNGRVAAVLEKLVKLPKLIGIHESTAP
jgi:hypothetical protein